MAATRMRLIGAFRPPDDLLADHTVDRARSYAIGPDGRDRVLVRTGVASTVTTALWIDVQN